MDFLEKDLEDIIYNAGNTNLNERGLPISGHMKRQVYIGNYGIADIITFERGKYNKKTKKHESSTLTIYELKKGEINNAALLQGVRYAKGSSSYLFKRTKGNILFNVKIVIIGRKISTHDDNVYLTDFCNAIDYYKYNYLIDGLYFDKISGYTLLEEGFKF